MSKCHVGDSCIIVALREVALEIKMAQFHHVAILAIIKDTTAIEIDLTITINKTQIHAMVEILHFKTHKIPSNSTYYNLE